MINIWIYDIRPYKSTVEIIIIVINNTKFIFLLSQMKVEVSHSTNIPPGRIMVHRIHLIFYYLKTTWQDQNV